LLLRLTISGANSTKRRSRSPHFFLVTYFTSPKMAADFAAESHYGLAGPAFVAHLAHLVALNPQIKVTLRERIDSVQKDLLKAINADGQVTRVARHFAFVALAGDSARAALNLPWDEGEPISAARICFKAWMSQRGGSGPQEILTAIIALREAIETHGQARFQRLHGTDDHAFESNDSHPIRDLLGYRFDLQGEAAWGFTPAGLKEVLRGVGDFQTLVVRLVDLGMVRRGPDRVQTGKKIGGEKRWLYVVLDSSVFKGEQH
jgi:putative DNA primase/helicase